MKTLHFSLASAVLKSLSSKCSTLISGKVSSKSCKISSSILHSFSPSLEYKTRQIYKYTLLGQTKLLGINGRNQLEISFSVMHSLNIIYISANVLKNTHSLPNKKFFTLTAHCFSVKKKRSVNTFDTVFFFLSLILYQYLRAVQAHRQKEDA